MELEEDHLEAILAGNTELDMFNSSTCTGVKSIGADGLAYVEFTDLFNHNECQPDCQVIERNGTLIEACRSIVGYDDLFHAFPNGRRVRL